MHETVDLQWVERYLPEWLVETKPWGVSLYRWILNPLILLLMLGFAWLATRILAFLFRHIFRRFIERNIGFHEVRFWGPARLFLFACLLSFGGHYGNTLLVRQFWNHVATIFIVTAVTWFSLRVIDLIARNLTNRLTHQIAAIQLFRGIAKALAVAVGLLVILRIDGFNLTTTLAGLGIGGVAVAFAAQKTIEDLFGTVMLVGDQPIRVGDFCRVGDTLGTVENIGLWSTRARTLDRTLVSVPTAR